MTTRLLRALVFCAVLSLTLTHAYGGSKTWTGITDSNWSTGTNWNPNGAPNGDVVLMPNTFGAVVNLDSGTATILSLELGNGPSSAALVKGNGAVNLTIEEELIINQGGSLQLQAGDVIRQTDPFSYFRNYGTLVVSAGAQLNTSSFDQFTDTVYAGSSFVIEGSLSLNYFTRLTEIEAGAGAVPAGQLYLLNGQVWDITPLGGPPTLNNSGVLEIGSGSTLNLHGTLDNGAQSLLLLSDPGTVVNLEGLSNKGNVVDFLFAKLFLLNQPNGITTIAAGSSFELFGDFYAGSTTSAPNGFYMLDTIDGYLELGANQTIDVTPGGGSLTVSSTGHLEVNSSLTGATLNLHGTLNNNGSVRVGPGGTLNLLNQPGGITAVVAGSSFDLYGTCNAGAGTNNCFNSLTSVGGTLILENGQTTTDTPIGGTLTIGSTGYVEVKSGTTLTIPLFGGLLGNTVVMPGGVLSIGDPGPTTVNIGGTLTNLGGQINVVGPQAVLNAGSIVNGGMLSLPEGSKVNVANGFYQLAAGTLGEAIGASGFSILVTADGQVMLAGTLDIMLDPGFNPTIGSTYQFLLFQPGELSGTFAFIQNQYFNHGTEGWRVIYDNQDGFVALEAVPSPEPASLLLLASGLLSMGYGLRRRMR